MATPAMATREPMWWADVAGIELSTAREQLRVARALIDLAAFAEGRLSYAKIKVLSRLAKDDTVDELIELGQPCAAGRLG